MRCHAPRQIFSRRARSVLFTVVVISLISTVRSQPTSGADASSQVCDGDQCMPAVEVESVPDQAAADDPQVCHGGHCAVPGANDPRREGASEGGDLGGGAPAGSSTASAGGPGEAGAGGEASPALPRKEWSDEELLRQCLSQMDDPEMCQMMVKVILPAPCDLHRMASASVPCHLTPAGRGTG